MYNNRKILENSLGTKGYELGCYSNEINNLSMRSINRILKNVEYQIDTKVSIKGNIFVVQIDIVDEEVDLIMISKQEYISRYCFDNQEFIDKFN
jgi:hypothetical protein